MLHLEIQKKNKPTKFHHSDTQDINFFLLLKNKKEPLVLSVFSARPI